MLKLYTKLLKPSSLYTQSTNVLKHSIKKYRSSKNPIIRLPISILDALRNKVLSLIQICTDRDSRSTFFLQLLNSKNVHQTTPLTFMNRYPIIFSACRDYFDVKQNLRILSYGCSTGEEVLTLRKYFPTAYIVGAEINKQSLKVCRKLPRDDRTTFLYSKYNEIQKHGSFDAIFCMAVFQRTPHAISAKGITSLKKIYPFEKFEQQLIELDKLLAPGGLLVVHFTQYSLCDTILASKYKALGDYNQDDYMCPIFDRNSNLIEDALSQHTIFIKLHE